MGLTLRLMSSGTLPNGRNTIDMVNGALTIGRGEENDLALPDPDRQLSKRHCVLEERNGDYVIIDISTNGTFLNYGTERLGTIPTPLNHGDVIQLGSFELTVEIAAAAHNARAVQPLPPAADSVIAPVPSAGAHPTSGLDDFLAGMVTPGHDPLDDLLGSSAPVAGAPSWNSPALPDDPLSAVLPGADSFLGGQPSPSQGASISDHRPTSQDYFAVPAVQSSAIPDDWDELFAPAPQEPAAQSAPQPAPPAPPAFEPPPAAPAFAPPPPPPSFPSVSATPVQPAAASVPPTPTSPATGDAAARAFLAGAGASHLNIPPAELEDIMKRLGGVFAAMVTGMREILMTRASIKSEMRMDRTMIGSSGNNPLKFSISPEQAIEAMIRPTVRGYLDADAATAEALNDIRAHEVAMMSGMQAALKDLLQRLGPDQLSARIESGTTLGSLLAGKKARYWEAYEKMYAQIAKETEDDFQSAFGREFARAYQAQLRKL
ncbi:type VI secretion system-associated FHA domain protein TagH [Rhizobium sp. GN54]|uniref:type VI secretion system-associated FHA domain protein TagH n=1 Tax=Rhizobium sp. GN54 TaxID=2898150 RepID=UPI001E3F41A8|nr:type VI secretion system-associated FHA domain protein TagH [Rhizobium sp. GN54]MCD2184677.1 type VI secretion system-associated FHA domain protein TagH [Rhizobium sp. GN54]